MVDAPLSLIVGLGNPGNKYVRTRHNIGFRVVNELVGNSAIWKEKDKSLVAEWNSESHSIVVMKPLTYMNLTGEPVQKLLSFRKFSVDQVLVVHDDLDIPFSNVRFKKGGGEAGHNGLKSISTVLGSKEYYRVRVGIGRPLHPSFEIADWVLSAFSNDEEAALPEVLAHTVAGIRLLLRDGLRRAQNEFND